MDKISTDKKLKEEYKSCVEQLTMDITQTIKQMNEYSYNVTGIINIDFNKCSSFYQKSHIIYPNYCFVTKQINNNNIIINLNPFNDVFEKFKNYKFICDNNTKIQIYKNY